MYAASQYPICIWFYVLNKISPHLLNKKSHLNLYSYIVLSRVINDIRHSSPLKWPGVFIDRKLRWSLISYYPRMSRRRAGLEAMCAWKGKGWYFCMCTEHLTWISPHKGEGWGWLETRATHAVIAPFKFWLLKSSIALLRIEFSRCLSFSERIVWCLS